MLKKGLYEYGHSVLATFCNSIEYIYHRNKSTNVYR